MAVTSPTDTQEAQYVGFDATNYKAFGSFNPIYRNVWTELTDKYQVPFARTVFFVLTAHIMHANELGIHFAGVGEIADIACYSDTTVLRAEMTLADELGWLKMHWIKDPTHPRGKAMPRYQINPWVMWIAQPFIADAIEWWWRATAFNRSSLHRNVIIKAQPESESESQSETTTRMSQPEQSSIKTAGQARQRQTTGDKPEQTRKRPQRKHHAAEVSLDDCKKPITNQQDESLAQAIAERFKTRQPQARQMVLSYGAATVTKAVDAMLLEAQNGKPIEKPFGYLLSQLRNNPPASDTASGSYADFFNR